MSIPQSTICVCENVRLNSRYEHTIYFADRSTQQSYFAGKVVKTFSAYSFIRKTWDLNVAATMEEAAAWAYLYFRNSANGKTYYYFIDNIEYVNDGTVRLKLQIDVLQTYLFDFDLLPCFVERQHASDDTIGANIMDENLDCGELIDCATKDLTATKELCIMILASINPNVTTTTKPVPALAYRYNNVFSGLKVWAVHPSKWAAWGQKLEDLSAAGFLDGIVNMWMYPLNLVELGGEATWDDDELCKPVESYSPFGMDITGKNDFVPFGGYEPKNNKLYCYPFNFLYLTNNAGASASYRYERFTGANGVQFRLWGTVSPEAAAKLVPVNYNGVGENYDAGVSLANFPTCAWNSDTYKMWLAQNYNQINVSGTTNAIQAAGGIAMGVGSLLTGNVAGALGGVAMAASGATQIAQQVAQQKDMQVQPPQARGNLSSGVNVTAGKQLFTIYNKSVDKQHARVIDDYFTMYGYKMSRVMKPVLNARKSHTYIKTIGCHISANLCNEDATRIEAIFDHGVTFWKNGDRIGEYHDDNSTL